MVTRDSDARGLPTGSRGQQTGGPGGPRRAGEAPGCRPHIRSEGKMTGRPRLPRAPEASGRRDSPTVRVLTFNHGDGRLQRTKDTNRKSRVSEVSFPEAKSSVSSFRVEDFVCRPQHGAEQVSGSPSLPACPLPGPWGWPLRCGSCREPGPASSDKQTHRRVPDGWGSRAHSGDRTGCPCAGGSLQLCGHRMAHTHRPE